MTFDAAEVLEEAMSLADEDDRRWQLLREIAEQPPSAPWARARILLTGRAFGNAELDEALKLSRSVVESTDKAVSEGPRAVAAIQMALTQNMLEQAWSEKLVEESIERCTATDPYYAGAGLNLLADRYLARGERLTAIRSLERAADLYDRAGSMVAGPGALHRLARLAIAENRPDAARAYLDRGIERVRLFPYAGFIVRGMEKKLLELRSIVCGPDRR